MQTDLEYGPSLVHVFRRRAAKHADTLYYRFLHGGELDGAATEVNWAQHDRTARRIAAKLQSLGARDERVLLLAPPGPDFIAGFSGCLYAGAVAVPTFPPESGRLARTLPRLRAIIENSRARFALAPEAICRMGAALANAGLTGIEWVASDQLEGVDEGDWEMPRLDRESLAFLQYTSGSTGSPRGVMVRHGNLLHNIGLIHRSFQIEEGDAGVSWLPVHHDMGLIGGILHAMPMTLMSPLDFLRRPLRWLEAISRTRSVISGGPDFAYRLCLKKIRDEELARLDLSCWRLAFSGSEPVRAATLEAFADRFAACGFDRKALYPTYGLAEATLLVSGALGAKRPPTYLDVDAAALEMGRVTAAGTGRRHPLVGCGTVDASLSVAIVDPETGMRRGPGEVGEIWVRGPSVAAGYWGDEETTRARFGARLVSGAPLASGPHEEHLRTGDLGFLHEGELFITGRLQDLLILRGRNVYPQDLEELAQAAHTRVRPSCVAAFGLELDGEERAVLVAEVDKRGEGFSSDEVMAAIRSKVADGAEVELHAVVLVRQGSIPKTTSGKVRRRATKQMWQAGEFEVIATQQLSAPASVELTAEPPRDRDSAIAVIRSLVAAEINRAESTVAIDEPLHTLGLDSLRLVEITARLEELFGRPLETLTLFSYPTIEALADFLVSSDKHEPAAASKRVEAGPYVDLAETCADIERRSTRYQFDLERDVEWDRIDEPGLYIPTAWLRDLGFDVDALRARPEALDLLQWAMAITVCTTFELLEFGVIYFARDEADRLGHTRSVELLAIEEEKHIQLFRRYARHLRAQRPELAEQLATLAAPGVEAIRSVLQETALAQRHYVIWLNFLFFEEYTVHLDKRLRESEGIQPTWSSAHAAHRREEIQHIATDVRYLRALDLDEAERRRISASFVERLVTSFDRQFGIEGVRQLLEHVYPGTKVMLERSLRAEECLQALLRDRTFAHCCKAGPFLREAIDLEPAQLLAAARAATRVHVSEHESELVHAGTRAEPMAIVGMGCRFPGSANSPDALWQLLLDGVDAITEVPPDRWDIDAWFDPDPTTPNKMYTRWGGFADHIHDFDHGFFGITPKEVRGMDPQQRMLLEVSWEALEHAGIPPSSLRGSSAGVFVGICSHDFGHRIIVDPIDAYSGTGIAFSVAAGRISYTLGITGPCIAVDTACSSSLVAVHQACRALEGRETNLALVAGVNAILVPKSHVFFSALRAMSPVGRCKSFDAAADGYVRSEGCGVVVLKRLADARRDGDRIFAVIRGSAVNQDGRSNGLTAPSGLGQESVMRAALARAGLSPAELDYVEAHGTGTPLGDPIELQAIGAVHRGRGDTIKIGSLKSQIGHSEGAAGIAGLIKATLIAERGQIPANLHFRQPTPQVPWSELPLEVVTRTRPLAAGRAIGVNAFGFGGTNAHVVIEPVTPTPVPARTNDRPVHPIVVSGHTKAALAENIARVAAALEHLDDAALPDVAHTLTVCRDHHALRVAVPARTIELARAGLLAHAESLPDRSPVAPRVAFVFTGQGAQYPGMGRALYETQPSYRAVIDELATYLDPLLDVPLRTLLFDGEASLTDTGRAQPALFAVELALASLWREWGVVPEVVLGHSVGEIAAACFAGMLSMSDAAELVAARGRLMQALPRDGAMFAISTCEESVRRSLARHGDALAIAAINTTKQIVISGDETAALEVARELSAEGVEVRRLDVSHAFHSPKMRPMLGDFASIAASLRFEQPSVPLISALDHTLDASAMRDPQYWVSHVRGTVRFADALEAAAARGVDTMIEIGPRPTLLGLAAKQLGERYMLLPSLWPPRGDWDVLADSLCRLHESGATIDWAAFDAPYVRRRVTLPTHAFMRERLWSDEAPALTSGGASEHPLLGVRLDVAGRDSFELTLSPSATPWLADHRVVERVVVPATAWWELLRAGAREVSGSSTVAICDVEIRRALLLEEHEQRRAQVVVETREDRIEVEVFSRGREAGAGWVSHARGVARLDVDASALPCPAPEKFPEAIDPAQIYAALASVGLDYGPRFRGLRSLRRSSSGVLAEVALPDDVARWSEGLHPVLLDAALQAVGALEDGSSAALRLPVKVGCFREFGRATSRAAALVGVSRADGGLVDVRLWDLDGRPLAELLGLSLRDADPAIFRQRDRARDRDAAFRLRWDAVSLEAGEESSASKWLIVGEGPLPRAVTARLGDRAELVHIDADLAAATRERNVLYFPTALEDPTRLEVVLAPLLQLAHARAPGSSLVIATTAAFAISSSDVIEAAALGSASAWGLGRTIQRESSGCRLLDLDPAASLDDSISIVLRELVGDDEDQVAWRSGQRLAARLVPASDGASVVPDSPSWRLRQREQGVLDSLTLEPIDRPTPGPGEVEIAVEAAGLNFRDVLGALGMLPGAPANMGGEFAGRVTAVGKGVTTLEVGDPVMGMAAAAFARHVITDARLVIRRPASLDASAGATIPAAYLTAWYGLYELGRLRAGDWCLIHAAAGGVGMAAVALARRIGANVIGTASRGKWDIVRERGVAHVFDSRTPGWSSCMRQVTGGAGVDVVLNSLTGAFIHDSFAALTEGGRFIEMGKAEIWDAAKVREVHSSAHYQAFDLLVLDPDEIQRMLQAIVVALEAGEIEPLPARSFAFTDAASAFRTMAQARHIGKIVLTSKTRERPRVDQGTWLLTGGLGGLGAQVAQWLVEHGARHLALVTRGPLNDSRRQQVAQLEAGGAVVRVLQADLSDATQVTSMVAEVTATMPPLRGVVHAAGVLDDATLAELSWPRFESVLAPKATAAWALHEATRDIPLEDFVLFSSVVGTLGGPGQANYAAANAFLDALAQHRRASGLPAVSIAWGPWAGAGMAARLDARQQRRLAEQGLQPIEPELGLQWFSRSLGAEAAHLIVAPLDLARLRRQLQHKSVPLLSVLAPARAREAGPSLSEALARLAPADRHARLVEVLRERSARVIGAASPEAVDPRTPLRDLGLDSLMGVDLHVELSRAVGRKLDETLLLDHPTLDRLATHLLEVLGLAATRETPAPTPMTNAEAELARELAALEGLL